MARQFAVTFDYRCPFARNGHESVIAGLRAGRDWDVTFLPFSLDQVHVEEGEAPVWERDPAERGTGVTALCWGIAVRDEFPDKFLDFHLAVFSARHEQGAKIAKDEVLAEIATSVGLDADAVAADVASIRDLRRSHVRRRRQRRVRALDGARTAGRHRPRARSARVAGAQRVQAHLRPEVERTRVSRSAVPCASCARRFKQ